MFIDIDCSQMKKYNQNAYGDYFISKRYPDEAKLIAVLSDGLGSGIKANILSCMTATMLLRFIEGDQIPISKAAEIIMNSLPVCQVRRISYSTFSGIEVDDDGNAKIVEEGNPEFIWIRANEVMKPEFKSIPSKTFKNRCLKVYKINLRLGDRLIFCSDGVTQSGLGGGKLKLGLRREGLINIVLDKLKDHPDISSTELSQYIVNQARNIETDRLPKDDISACVLYFREPREALIFTGPPYHQEKDAEYAKIFDIKIIIVIPKNSPPFLSILFFLKSSSKFICIINSLIYTMKYKKSCKFPISICYMFPFLYNYFIFKLISNF